MKVFFVRHQAAGIVYEHPFAEHPSSAQIEPVRRLVGWRHGWKHPRTGQPYWLDVVPIDVHGPGVVPSIEIEAASAAGAEPKGAAGFSLAGLEASGKAHVRNPAKAAPPADDDKEIPWYDERRLPPGDDL